MGSFVHICNAELCHSLKKCLVAYLVPNHIANQGWLIENQVQHICEKFKLEFQYFKSVILCERTLWTISAISSRPKYVKTGTLDNRQLMAIRVIWH